MENIKLDPEEVILEPLNESNKHHINSFSSTACQELELFLKENAWEEQVIGFSRTYLFFHKRILAGYATILMNVQKIDYNRQNDSLIKLRDKTNQGYTSVPAIKIGRLCVSDDYNTQLRSSHFSGMGKIIFSAVLGMTMGLSQEVGCRLITTHAKKSTKAYKWYEKLGFLYSFNEEKTKELLVKENVDSIPMLYDLHRILR